ncbi:hypothetical protein ACLJYM_06215 [Rhizobium giardinii]|uniref:hypothetical protein n=1 Tax=Rhizobium giardinii TaxID=56731 RepID=UPI0039DF89F0
MTEPTEVLDPANGIGSRELVASFPSSQKRQVQRIIQANLDAGTLVITSDMRFIPAPAHPPVQEPVVKALEWTDNRGGGFNAVTVAGIYSIDIGEAEYRVFVPGKWPPIGYTSLEEAKAAAQSDYERRIRSALVPLPCESNGVDSHKQGELEGKVDSQRKALEEAYIRGATWYRQNEDFGGLLRKAAQDYADFQTSPASSKEGETDV